MRDDRAVGGVRAGAVGAVEVHRAAVEVGIAGGVDVDVRLRAEVRRVVVRDDEADPVVAVVVESTETTQSLVDLLDTVRNAAGEEDLVVGVIASEKANPGGLE